MSHSMFAVVAVSGTLMCVSARAEGTLTWAGHSPESEVRSIEVDCGDTRYRFVLNHAPGKLALLDLERVTEPFSADVTVKMKELVAEFGQLNPLEFSCGSGPNDGERERILSENRYQDFTGTLQVEISGMHRSSLDEAEKNCAEKGYEFRSLTRRTVTLLRDGIEVAPNTVGTCSTGLQFVERKK